MSYQLTNLAEKLYNVTFSAESFESIGLDVARAQFEEYRKNGVIISGVFEDASWQTSDEYSHVGLHFNFDGTSYKMYYQELFQVTYDDFINYVKIYILYLFGKNVLNTIQTMLNDLKRMVSAHPGNIVYGHSMCPFFSQINLCLDFLYMLPDVPDSVPKDAFLRRMEAIAERDVTAGKKSRTLAQFESYFLFNDILEDYWAKSLSEEDRLFYYPLYLWWVITAVIPERPREFILTERNCLEYDGDDIYLILRKNCLKGSERTVTFYK